LSTRLLDRTKWQREEAHRWDAKRLESYGAFAASIKDFMSIARRISASHGLPSTGQLLDVAEGLPLLAEAEADLGAKWEIVLMLGSPAAVVAAKDWRHFAWHLEWFARGLRQGAEEYSQTKGDGAAARRRFYSAVGKISALPVGLPQS
jgi:hypothetical protein